MQTSELFVPFNSMMSWMMKILEDLSLLAPLEVYVFLGSFLEEIFPPIPSPLVLTLAGTVSAVAGRPIIWLFILAIVSSVGKVIGMWLIYVFVDKLEGIVVGRLGKYIGVSSKSLESIGKMFDGTWKDEAIIFFTRAIPVVPSTPLSVLAGLIKLNLKSYLIWSFLGTIVRSITFLYIGYAGLTSSLEILEGEGSIGMLLKLGSIAFLGVLVIVVYLQREKRDLLFDLSSKINKLRKKMFGA